MDAQSRNTALHLLLIGSTNSPEMRPVADAIATLPPHATIDRAPNVRSAIGTIAELQAHPDLIVVCQHWPDEYAPSDADRLIASAPLARIICCYGAWCESDGRSRDVWPPAVRVPVFVFGRRLHQEIEILRGACAPLPLTASRDESFAFNMDEFGVSDRTRQNGSRQIGIHTPDRALERWLMDLLASAGHQPSIFRRHGDTIPQDVLLCDLDPWDPVRLEHELGTLACSFARAQTTKIIGLMGLVHPEDTAVARSLGVDTLVPKLSPIDDLLAAVV